MGRTSATENDFEAFPGLEDLLLEIEKEEYGYVPRKQAPLQSRAVSSTPSSLQVDDTVVIDGLKAAAELNGCLGVIEAWDNETSRWRVRVKATGEAKRIKADNLIRQAPILNNQQPQRQEDLSFASRMTPNGSIGYEIPRVPQSSAAIGTKARVRRKSRSQSRKRHEVEADNSDFRRGMLVKVVNLEATPHLNGSEAVCEHWDSEVKRWMVRLIRDGTLKRVRPANLEAQESVDVRLAGPAGMLVHLDVGKSWQVKQIKEAIERHREDYPTDEQRLLFEGQELDDSERVSEILTRRADNDEVLDITLYRRPVFSMVSGSSSSSVGGDSRESEVAQKLDAGMSAPWASIEGNLRASHLRGKAPFGSLSQHQPSPAGKGVDKGLGRFVATRHPELAVGRRLVH